MIGEQFCD